MPRRAGVCQQTGQGSGKAETIRQHGFGARRIDIALLYRRTGGKPAARLNTLANGRVLGGIVFPNQLIAVGAAEVENVVRILFEKAEVLPRGLGEKLPNDLRILPAPFRIKVGITD